MKRWADSVVVGVELLLDLLVALWMSDESSEDHTVLVGTLAGPRLTSVVAVKVLSTLVAVAVDSTSLVLAEIRLLGLHAAPVEAA